MKRYTPIYLWEPTQPGESLLGTHAGYENVKTSHGVQKAILIKTHCGIIYKLSLSKGLQTIIARIDVRLTDRIRINYQGKRTGKDGRQFHAHQVLRGANA